MHPVIRITTFILLAILLARAHPMQMGWVLCVIGLAFIFESGKGITAAVRLLWRIRWLLLSIMLVYTWLPLGTLTESLWLASHRIALLVMMLFALQVLVLNMARDDIVLGLYIVFFPFCLFGLSREKMVLRLILTLESISELPKALDQKLASEKKKSTPFSQIAERLTQAITCVLTYGDNINHAAVTIKTDSTVPVWQWFLPITVAAVFFSLLVFE